MNNNYNIVYGEIDHDQLRSEREDLRTPEDNKDMPVMLTPAQAAMREEIMESMYRRDAQFDEDMIEAERSYYSMQFDRYQH